ncbi:unnamed protein product [Notodromas monacha]|uniref:Homeobox domain-containing protein n=1 Tax=Notodromas monacha TaxID=399045 RepID=A0A7R9GED8_9CRUS|nr:unnamed protein product [Notodromas monacha]CAG0917959.1 unnamed protein product [Notodromas monacha]
MPPFPLVSLLLQLMVLLHHPWSSHQRDGFIGVSIFMDFGTTRDVVKSAGIPYWHCFDYYWRRQRGDGESTRLRPIHSADRAVDESPTVEIPGRRSPLSTSSTSFDVVQQQPRAGDALVRHCYRCCRILPHPTAGVALFRYSSLEPERDVLAGSEAKPGVRMHPACQGDPNATPRKRKRPEKKPKQNDIKTLLQNLSGGALKIDTTPMSFDTKHSSGIANVCVTVTPATHQQQHLHCVDASPSISACSPLSSASSAAQVVPTASDASSGTEEPLLCVTKSECEERSDGAVSPGAGSNVSSTEASSPGHKRNKKAACCKRPAVKIWFQNRRTKWKKHECHNSSVLSPTSSKGCNDDDDVDTSRDFSPAPTSGLSPDPEPKIPRLATDISTLLDPISSLDRCDIKSVPDLKPAYLGDAVVPQVDGKKKKPRAPRPKAPKTEKLTKKQALAGLTNVAAKPVVTGVS